MFLTILPEEFMFIQWLRQPNVVPTPFGAQIALLARGKFDYSGVLALAEKMYKHHLSGLGLDKEGVQAFLDLCITIDDRKAKVVGVKADTRQSNMVMACLGAMMAEESEVSQAQYDWICTLTQQLSLSSGYHSWFHSKALVLASAVRATQCLRSFVDAVAPASESALETITSSLQGTSIKNVVDGMVTELMAFRKYGIKACYFQDGLFHDRSSAWVFQDARRVGGWSAVRDSLSFAIVSLGPVQSIGSLDINTTNRHIGMSTIVDVDLGFEPSLVMGMDKAGEFFGSPLAGLMSARRAFAAANKEDSYELLRMISVLRLQDMLLPVLRVKNLPSLPFQRTGLVAALASLRRPRPNLDPELLLPRLRVMENSDILLREVDEETERGMEETARRSGKVRHQVVGFVRPLPRGYKASARARKLAWEEQGIVLQEGETYVSEHHRGNVEADRKGHRAKTRH